MRWMQWVREQTGRIWTTVPIRLKSFGRKKPAGWLLGRDGCLKAVSEPVLITDPTAGPFQQFRRRETTFAGGLRLSGAGRLNGVLHYFTRGPDGIF